MNQHLQNILNLLDQTNHLTADEKERIIKSLQGANNDLETSALKLDRNEKEKVTAGILLEKTIAELEMKRREEEKLKREFEVEAALEHVRSRSLAMLRSDELQEVIMVISEQLQHLGFRFHDASFARYDDKNGINFWLASPGHPQPYLVQVPYLDNPIFNRPLEAMKKGVDFVADVLSPEENHQWLKHFVERSTLNNLSEADKKYLLTTSGAARSLVITKHIILVISNFASVPYTDEQNGVLKRFGNVFDQAYTRFLDLQKAETQARGAQIEASLERVRSRSMGMQKSEELKEVINLVYEQLVSLNIHVEHAGFLIDYKTRDDLHIWLADHHLAPSEVTIPCFDCPPNNAIRDAKEKGDEFFFYHLNFEEKNKFYRDLFKLIPGIPEETINYYLNCPGLAGSGVLLDNIGLYIENFSGAVYTKEENTVLMRFGKVFQQTYTRFLDLQKAEAQSREAQIQLALERVRARTMAMQKSEELKEVVKTIVDKITGLNIEMNGGVSLVTFSPDSKDLQHWLWIPEQLGDVFKAYLPYFDHRILKDCDDARNQGVDLLAKVYSGKDKQTYFDYLFTKTEFSVGPEDAKAWVMQQPFFGFSFAIQSHSGIFLNDYSGKYFSKETNEILIRFALVFEQAYTRFLDLQKAEAQARVAQIEAALERVRSKTMAMHSSTDIAETVDILFHELTKLYAETIRCGISIIHQNKEMEVWTANSDEKGKSSLTIGKLSMDITPSFRGLFEAWRKKEPHFAYDLSGQNLKDYFTALNNSPDYPIRYDLEKLPPRQVVNCFLFTEGALFVFTNQQLTPEADIIFKRFALSFGQTYRRYLDLQKAEAQAREAQIQLALERVRARTMAMQKSTELNPTADLLFDQLKFLGADLQGVAFAICDRDSDIVQKWTSIGIFSFSYTIEPAEQNMYEAWKNQVPLYEEVFEGERIKKYYETLMEVPAFKQGLQKLLDAGIPIPAWQKNHVVSFKQGYLLIITKKPFPETQIFIRFGKVFEQTYTRFLDLQKAEVNAREAVKQAALDRIRADIASMRTVNDLDRITPVIWNELTILGISFQRCGVFIMDDEKELIHTFLSTPDGKAIAAIHIPYDTPGKIKLVPQNWKLNRQYTDNWNDTDFNDFANALLQQHAIVSADQYLAGVPPGRFYLHFVPFLQGMLYVGNSSELSKDDINVIQSVAEAFSTAYARYEDFNKLEAAKNQVDSALDELRATQRQLIQSEKMASLGELTAGIAHEIQNPLNFVNNFSEVSNELIDEMNEELDKGDIEEAKAIASDLKQNLEKINHHGKRADDIVKGMLQHSRKSSGQKEPTDINALCDEYLRLSFHGMRAKDKSFKSRFETNFDTSLPRINVVPQEIGRVILNLINNAFYASAERSRSIVSDKSKQNIAGYEPDVFVSTRKETDKILISVKDNGNGIPASIKDKIFQPFFTTKPTGQGTGLGLSLSYDIIKAHGGEIKVESKEGEGAEFVIELPVV